ncbi:MAG: helix-turn-helix domain-containing protein [Chlamydiales bacterium]|nr:helix-turn-helix domain-containing protein [Chlamydiales bacterium]
MSKSYHHQIYDQRCQIYILKDRGDSASAIAKILKVHHSTIKVESLRKI